MKEAVIVSGARTAVGRAPRGTLRASRPDDMAGAAIAEAVARAQGLDPAEVEDVLLGCAITEGSQGMNVARIAAQRAGLPDSAPGQTVNRFCSSGLQTIASSAERIMAGFATTLVAGGTEHMSSTPTPTPTFSPNPEVVRGHPEYYMSMGLTGERVAERWGVSREDQDAFALRSHRRALHHRTVGGRAPVREPLRLGEDRVEPAVLDLLVQPGAPEDELPQPVDKILVPADEAVDVVGDVRAERALGLLDLTARGQRDEVLDLAAGEAVPLDEAEACGGVLDTLREVVGATLAR